MGPTKMLLVLLMAAAGCSKSSANPPLASLPVVSVKPVPKRIGFKGDTPGIMTFAQFTGTYASHPVDEEGRPVEGGQKAGEGWYAIDKLEGWTIATVPITRAVYRFWDGRLESIALSTKPDRERLICDALDLRAGRDSRLDDPGVNVRPAGDSAGKHEWNNKTTRIILVSEPKGSLVTFADNAVAEERDRLVRIRKANAEGEKALRRAEALKDL